ncbi:MAG: hypothetical protein ACREMY_05280 [bacterium]
MGTYSAPMSYVGSARRLSAWTRRKLEPMPTVARVIVGVVLWTVVLSALMVVWMAVTVWYVVVFGVFGLFAFPWRLHRRSQRKTLAAIQAKS